MMRSKRRLPILSLMLWFIAVLPATAAEGPDAQRVKRVLVVGDDHAALPVGIDILQGIRRGLGARWQTRLELYTEYLDILRFPSADHLHRLKDDLTAKYANVHLDVLIAVGAKALQFMLENRAEIAAGAPLIFGLVSDDERPAAQL